MNTEAEAEYEDKERYLREGQAYEEERRQLLKRLALERREPAGNLRHPQHNIQPTMEEVSEDEHSVFYQIQIMMAQVTEDKATITKLTKQMKTDKIVISDLYDKIENSQFL